MSCFGPLAPCPLRLGGSPEEGWTAEQHARVCADLVAAWRAAPLAVMSVDGSGAVTWYHGRNGSGLAHAPVVTYETDGPYVTTKITWDRVYATGIKDEFHRFAIRSAEVSCDKFSGLVIVGHVDTLSANEVVIKQFAALDDSTTRQQFRLAIYGDYGPARSIGDYGGSLDKKNNETEHPETYAAQLYRDIQQQRGTAFTTSASSLVHAENLATARMWGSVGYRLPEKLRANLTPRRSDEGLEYWAKVLQVPRGPGETRAQLRDRCAIQYRSGQSNDFPSFQSAVSDLLGDAFVGVTLNHDGAFETPSVNTYWPVINPGSAEYSLGGGAWLSDRLHVTINVAKPGGMPTGEYDQLVNVSLFQLVDRLLPAWATASWADSTTDPIVWDGGILWDSGAEWNALFDWNS